MRRTALFAVLLLASSTAVSAGVVRRIGSLAARRHGPTLTALPGGRFLVAGGNGQEPRLELLELHGGRAVSLFSAVATPLPLVGHTATLLPAGQVLLIGGGYKTDGRPAFGAYGDQRVSLYEGETLTPLPLLTDWRLAHEATLLPDGSVLVTGGMTENVGGFHLYQDAIGGAELVTAAGTRLTGRLHEKRAHHTATVLRDGRVLVTGGEDFDRHDLRDSDTAEVWDPASEIWQLVGSMHASRSRHTATLLQDGRVLVAGGNSYGGPTAEIFDPETNRFTAAADVGYRKEHAAQLLPDGTVLLFGGSASAVVYDPETDSVVDSVELPEVLERYAAALLPDGSVLLAGEGDVFRYTRTATSRRRAARH